MNGPLLIRADAGARIGSGHVMRCLALTEEWQRAGGGVILLSAALPAPLADRFSALGARVVEVQGKPGGQADATQLSQLALAEKASWAVVDGYHFAARYRGQVRERGLRLLWIDDLGSAEPCHADLVLNQNLGATADLYPGKEPGTRLLLGCRYVLLRREFLKWRGMERVIVPVARKLLVTLGGADADNVTGLVIDALNSVGQASLEATVLVGAGNPHGPSLEAAARESSIPIRLIRDASNVGELMAEADLAIAAGGTTAWELAFMGLPSLLVAIATNQNLNIQRLATDGGAMSLGSAEQLSPGALARAVGDLLNDLPRRTAMARQGQALIDGRGVSRTWIHLQAARLSLRPVTEADARLLWEWANAPEVRAASFSPSPIPWEQHLEWLRPKLRQPGPFWLASIDGQHALGQVRFDPSTEPSTVVISTSIDAQHRGQGLGALLIWTACRKLFEQSAIERVHAWVKPDNMASRRAFEKAGFQIAEQRAINGQPAFLYEWMRGPEDT